MEGVLDEHQDSFLVWGGGGTGKSGELGETTAGGQERKSLC